ncbi:Replicative DNA helicase [compost metagenome]
MDNRQNKRPTISDLYGGNGIKSVADLILLLYRDDYYDPDSPDKGLLEVNLAKQRNGPTGRFKLKYDRDYQLIT